MGALSDALGLHPLTVKEIIGGDDAGQDGQVSVTHMKF